MDFENSNTLSELTSEYLNSLKQGEDRDEKESDHKGWVFRFFLFFRHLPGNRVEEARLIEEIERLHCILKKLKNKTRGLLTDSQLNYHEEVIERVNQKFSTWNSPRRLLDSARVYKNQKKLLDEFKLLLNTSRELREVYLLLSNKPELKEGIISKKISQLSNILYQDVKLLLIRIDDGKAKDFLSKVKPSDIERQHERLSHVIDKRIKKLEGLNRTLKVVCRKANDPAISFLRVLSDKSGVESASVALSLIAASGACFSIPYYYHFKELWILDYWVVEDYFDAGLIPFFIIFPFLYISSVLLNRSCRTLLNDIAEGREGSKLSVTARISPGKTLFILIIICMTITVYYGCRRGMAKAEEIIQDEYVVTNQKDKIEKTMLVGTSARAAFFIICTSKEKCRANGPNSKLMVLDRAQVLCHSKGKDNDSCFTQLVNTPPNTIEEKFLPLVIYDRLSVESEKVDNASILLDTYLPCKTVKSSQVIRFIFREPYDNPIVYEDQAVQLIRELNSLKSMEFSYLLAVGMASYEGKADYNLNLAKVRAEKVANVLKEEYKVFSQTLGGLPFRGGDYKDYNSDKRVDIFLCK